MGLDFISLNLFEKITISLQCFNYFLSVFSFFFCLGGQDDVNSIYSISGIPSNYLIDEKGIIIARNLRGNKLEQKLEELFQKKTILI